MKLLLFLNRLYGVYYSPSGTESAVIPTKEITKNINSIIDLKYKYCLRLGKFVTNKS